MESFGRLLNYPGNVKAAIICKIVRIVFAKFLRLPVIGAHRCGNPVRFLREAASRCAQPVSCIWTKLRALRPIE